MNPTSARRSVDLNSDLGEGFGAWKMGDDNAILEIVSSANVACGMHAGDPHIMARTFARAKELGVAVGAHPGYPDLWGFGRRELPFSAAEIEQFVAYQVGAAKGVSTYVGHPITYVKPHGALGNLSQVDETVAGAIVRAMAAVDRELVLLTFPDGHATRIAKEMGLRTCAEIFADRAYTAEGRLVSRKLPGAVLDDCEEAAARVLRMVDAGGVETIDGTLLPMEIGSICVHGDSPGAIQMAAAIRTRLTEAGIAIKSFA
ncbi:LamB/YcsF family protein [Variovorax sp. WS11]|uniref:LamB/YcsF family protein n=1 Tax=Variovorax sp. WS11 TaxID=1105204 RepID=UPI000D0D96BB|nr:5-oxoprolinase subunit PxpA [Variovorax sp. WS11]NDZ18220.1 LamB/YcsF family protein [Variovorax sp. WS11]PSL84228.1 LamB/YcsF family protein [Variovorax sp. WS11]